jgi:predicted O-linked N-acetylglucosamine transferase (SPINDLY family)
MLQRFEEALESHNRALILDSQSIDALNNRGNTLNLMRCHDEAALCFLEAYRLKGESGFSLGRAHHQMMLCANWDDFDKFTLDINEGVLLGNLVAEPFGYQGICESEKHLRICAESFSSRFFPQLSFEAFVHDRVKKDKIRIGYLCGEFRDHATTHLMIGVWEQHNKDHFELYAFDNGHDDKSSYRGRVENAFSRIFSISSLSDREVAQLIYGCGIHILIDMNVYFGNSRHGILSFRPAPVQINFLGFPGTSGAPYVDYIIADENVIPKGSARFYTESIIYLPDTYQANDDRRTYPIIKLHRSDFGLPDNVFVFCCFNNNYKITPAVFKVWMSILTTCENSVLWLLEDNNSAKSNLLLSAQRLGVSPGRLVFSGRVPCYEHLNRHQLADLFLDTWPYNAHTTASDALWCCLPLITLCGTTFPGRVAASLLRAIGMPELVTTDVAQYEALAIELASHPTRVTELRNKLIQNRCTQPLFNTTLYTQHLECSYRKVYNRYISGLDPTSFTICPSSSVPRSLPSHQSL